MLPPWDHVCPSSAGAGPPPRLLPAPRSVPPGRENQRWAARTSFPAVHVCLGFAVSSWARPRFGSPWRAARSWQFPPRLVERLLLPVVGLGRPQQREVTRLAEAVDVGVRADRDARQSSHLLRRRVVDGAGEAVLVGRRRPHPRRQGRRLFHLLLD